MSRKVLITVVALALLLVVIFSERLEVGTSNRGGTDYTLSDYFQRHPGERIQVASAVEEGIPVTGAVVSGAPATDLTDYAARHPGANMAPAVAPAVDMTDYAARHPGLVLVSSRAPAVDLTDYAARHPEFTSARLYEVDTTDYYFRRLGQD